MKKYNEFIEEKQEDIAMQATSLFFQEEMLEKSEMIDFDALQSEIYTLKEDGIDMISWKDLYPILKRCVI
jgi:hypothetical protein